MIDMEKLKEEIEEWKEWLIEDLQKIIKEEIEKDMEILLENLNDKGIINV